MVFIIQLEMQWNPQFLEPPNDSNQRYHTVCMHGGMRLLKSYPLKWSLPVSGNNSGKQSFLYESKKRGKGLN